MSQSHIKEEEKLDALRLLLTVSNAGRSYKEVICENRGEYICVFMFVNKFVLGLFSHLCSGFVSFAPHVLATLLGVKVVAECLVKSSTEETQEAAQMLLESLFDGNTKYQSQLYKGLIALLTCSSPGVLQRVLHTLQTVQVNTHSHT